MTVELFSDHMFVQLMDADPAGTGTLIIHAGGRDPSQPRYAHVLACGPGRTMDSGTFVPIPCKPGDIVLTHPNPGTEMRVDGHDLRLVYARDLLGVVKSEGPTLVKP